MQLGLSLGDLPVPGGQQGSARIIASAWETLQPRNLTANVCLHASRTAERALRSGRRRGPARAVRARG